MAVPTVQVNVSFDAGFAADPKDALGTQALTLRVMREGTTTRNSRQLAEESERLGANMSSGASLDRTSIGISTLSANLGLSLDLLADVIIALCKRFSACRLELGIGAQMFEKFG